MFIFSLINILIDRQKKKEKKRQTSDKYTCIQKIVLLFQLSQKITIRKVVLYISENYNQQSCSLHRPFSIEDHDQPTPNQGKNHKKEKEKEKWKEKEKEKEKGGDDGGSET